MGLTPGPRAQVGQCHWALGWTGCPSATWLWAPHDEDRLEPTQGWPDHMMPTEQRTAQRTGPQSFCQFLEAVLGEGSGSTL